MGAGRCGDLSRDDAFLKAVQGNDAATVSRMLDEDAGVLRRPPREGSYLLTAVYHGAQDVVRSLLGRREDPLDVFEAAAVGDAPRLARLLAADPSLANRPNRDGFTPLGLAAFFGHAEAVRVLLDHGAEIDAVDRSRFANTALDAAVAANRVEPVKVLLEAGASVNVRSAGGYTPLHKAAMNGNLEVVGLLLARGADLDARDDNGRTPLTWARSKGHKEVALYLRQRGASE